ncbi:TonB-dependent receptor [Bacteroides pyogenes]|uniref:TonB-dependent receptor n=1 Tax=Bacteroides pyogenes TaxID=310300 RepID=UPI001BAAA5CF|nr:TonB-dependent receptor [Bacteroides pyogenes]MBR8725154.1 hypothetical protein [Bacteroides pyogenes]MBR8738657.1 hypothetical protein [Bacteroides pyogenes]MBR8754399.1 hypothetical protein [Bacteroides pyogenes]MBR8795742.1 hypothetical protein [Bacteroides pyogenes]MBR8809135.1 hypothetical protein [Bacteroides pyogenes]
MKISISDYAKTIVALLALTALWIISTPFVNAQDGKKARIYGTIYESDNNERLVPLDFASISLPDYAIGTASNNNGRYTLSNIPYGKARLQVKYLGKQTIDTLIHISGNIELNFVMRSEDFRIKEIVVIAENNQAGKATSSKISRMTMDHLQATSLHDLLVLLPGGTSSEPNLNNAQQINIRQISTASKGHQTSYSSKTKESDLNALGTAIIKDGAPVSNNSNLQALNPTVQGATAALGGGSSPSGGLDVRSISTENIESVEVIRGIPSVEYGDLTAGAVIIHTKAGREPLRIKGKANPNVYQVSLGTGFELGKNRGSLNVSGDYAYNTNDPKSSYIHYQRATAKLLYSNVLFKNKLRSNTSIDFIYGKDQRDRNPDDERTQTASKGQDAGVTFNTNGTWNLNKGWLQNIRYVGAVTYTSRTSFYESVYSSANAPYSMTTTDGAVLSNKPGQHIFDANGEEITNFGKPDEGHYAIYLPNSYKGRYDIDSKEINVFAKISANLFKKYNSVNNRILLGIDFKSDGNIGDGKTYNPSAPPYRVLRQKDATFRPRPYRDIPFVKQLGAFMEENFRWEVGERSLNIQAGLRYDKVSVVKDALSPRINASFDIVPNRITLRGGYGIAAKMPTLLYLFPEKAYFEYINLNELANENIPENERLFITTTKVYDTENNKLKIAKNHKAEIGLDLNLEKAKLAVTAFSERLKDGYSLDRDFNTFKPFTHNEYKRDADNKLALAGSYPVLSDFYKPGNNWFVNTKGVEFSLNVERIDAIRTSFQLNGSWMRTESYNDGYDFYDNSPNAPSARKDIAIYATRGSTNYGQQFATTLRTTHNIPSIGFVITLTTQAIWQQSDWKTFGNDSIPIGYISTKDASVHMFPANQYTTIDAVKAAGYEYMLQNVDHTKAIKESNPAYFCFNINITKEISNNMRVSFFANNMFRSYPRVESKRKRGTYNILNNRFYFGLELAITL